MKCIILEDEKSAQEILSTYIHKTPFITCLGVYESGLNIPTEQLQEADILFLDIQLPEINGLSFLRTLRNPPKVICTTAHVNYAIEAFEEAVTDYLVKPFSYERFFKSIIRVREQLSSQGNIKKEQLFLYADKTIYSVLASDILYLEAQVDYVKVITKDQQILISDSLQNWKEKLHSFGFSRIHRSYIVNTSKITKVYGNNVYVGETAIPVGKTFKKDFFRLIGKSY